MIRLVASSLLLLAAFGSRPGQAAQEPPVIPSDFSIAPQPSAAPASTPAVPADPEEAAAFRMVKAAQAAGFRGTVLYGNANDSFTIVVGAPAGAPPPDKGQGLWRWASVTKQVVAVLALMEAEGGRLDLDAPIAGRTGDVTVPNADRITPRMLLQHTSGLGSDEDGPKDMRGRLRRYLAAEPAGPAVPAECLIAAAEPGARFRYNNCDTLVAAAVVAHAAGKPIATLFAERLAAPLKLTRTRFAVPGERLTEAQGPDATAPDDGHDEGRFGAAGGLVGPVQELYAFDAALMAGRLLNPASMAALWNGDPKIGFAALGAWVYDAPLTGCSAPVRLVERRGEIGQTQIRNIIAPQLRRIAIAVTNHEADFGEPWQSKGLTHALASAAFCPESRTP